MPQLARISIFPIKSLDGLTVTEAQILPSGALKGDREFAIIDSAGKFVNGKRNAKIHLLRSTFALDARTVTLWVQGQIDQADQQIFNLDGDQHAMSDWFSDYFEQPVKLVQNLEMGFPDDTDSPGPTIISTATLTTVASWFPQLSYEQAQQRFRTNLEVENALPFWEDRLFASAESSVIFRVGDVQMEGINPCQRCIVPTRDPETGEVDHHFQKIFIQKRQKTLPDWVERSRFNHFYRLAINTRIPISEAGKVLAIGNEYA
jgi:uncharacterized protein